MKKYYVTLQSRFLSDFLTDFGKKFKERRENSKNRSPKYYVMKTHRLVLFFLLLFCVATISAQNTYNITGALVDSVGKEKIFYAQVALLTSDTASQPFALEYTNSEGKFTFEKVPAGEYILHCMLFGYTNIRKSVVIGGNERKVDLGTINMTKGSFALQGIEVAAQKPIYMIEGEKTLYNVSEDPTIHSGTATDALQNAPGVEVDIEGNVTVRGAGSVEIWLNDRPSNMNADALKDFLQQMPADNIERIEVITNPSAKYSANGAGSIINIVTVSKIKKNSFVSFGLHGSSTPNITPWVSYVWSDEKFSINLYANYNFSFYKYDSESSSTIFDDNGDTSSVFSSKYHSLSKNHRFGLYINGHYDFDTMNTLSFWGGTYPGFGRGSSASETHHSEFIQNIGLYDYNSNDNDNSNNLGGYGGLSFNHKFNDKGHEINADFSFSGGKYGSSSTELKDYASSLIMDLNRQNISQSNYYSLGTGIDYTIPYHENGEIEIGVSGSYDYEQNYSRIDTLVFGSENQYLTDSMRFEHYTNWGGDFDAYVTLQHKFGGFTLKGGLRTQYEAFNYRYPEFSKYDFQKGYWGFYPSLHLSYSTKSMHNFKLSYTRRVSYPDGHELSPFISYGDDEFSTGNPDLKPAYTNSVEAGWSKYINKFGNIALNAYFRNTKDETCELEDVVYDPYFGRIVAFSKPMNAGKSLNTGLDLNVTYRLKAFMSIRFYSNVYYKKQEFMFRDEADMRKVDNVSYSFRLNFWAKLWKVLEVNLSGNYRSKSVDMFSLTKPRYSIDCGLRAEFWKHHISVYVDVSDIFNWNKMSFQSNNPYYTSTSTFTNSWSSRAIRGGIVFRFGKMELEGQARQGATQQGQ